MNTTKITKRKHKSYRLTKYIKVLGKQNAWNNYEEEISQLEEEEALRNDLGSLSDDLLAEYKHPAIDAKQNENLKLYLVLLLMFQVNTLKSKLRRKKD